MMVPLAFEWPLQFCSFIISSTFFVSVVTSNVSQIDRLWTFLPVLYIAYYALLPLWPLKQVFFLAPFAPDALERFVIKDYSPRALLILVLSTIWMVRLSYNTYRRGLFKLDEEDYRWAVLRAKLPGWSFQVTNLIFISGIQSIILLLLGLPAYVATVLQPHTALSTSDYVIASLALIALAVEFTADNQQYAYHAYKRTYFASIKNDISVLVYDPKIQWIGARFNWTPADARRGFITRGLWGWSRHPNFLCEQCFWWLITLMPLVSPGRPNLPSFKDFLLISTIPNLSSLVTIFYSLRYLSPAIVLSILFFSSTLFTESITASKYANYRAYQKRVAMFDPFTTVLKTVVWAVLGRKVKLDAVVWGSLSGSSGKAKGQ